MKKVIALVLVVLIAVMLTGCGGDQEAEDLRQELQQVKGNQEAEELQQELQQVKGNQLNGEQSGNVTEEMLELLTIQLNSEDYSNWNAVAECPYATREHLQEVAKKTASIAYDYDWAKELAESICNNPNTTDEVLEELARSDYKGICNIVAKCEKSGVKTLNAVAKKTASIAYDYDWAKELAESICNNPNVTAEPLKELAKSSYSSVSIMAHQKLESMIE